LSADHRTATFTFASDPIVTEGPQTMTVPAGAVFREGDPTTLNQAFSGQFYFDTVPLAVTTTDPPFPGRRFTLPAPFTYAVKCNEPIAAGSVGTDDLTLNVGTVSSAVASGPSQATYTISGITTDTTLNVAIAAGKLTDAFGNPNLAPFSASYIV